MRITVGTSAALTNQFLSEAIVCAADHAPFRRSVNFRLKLGRPARASSRDPRGSTRELWRHGIRAGGNVHRLDLHRSTLVALRSWR